MSVFNLGDDGQPAPVARPRATASRPTGRSDALAVRPAPKPVRQVAATATAGADDWEEF